MNLVSLELLAPVFIILGVFIFAAWLLQRINRRSFAKNTAINIHSAISVGPNERILLIEIADQWLLVGSAPGRVNTLLKFDNPPSFTTEYNRTQPGKNHHNPPTDRAS